MTWPWPYSPGVAAPCEEIVKDPNAVFKYTSRGNLVAVITNGTAVLGLGNIGPLTAKPVMEGKAVLFKKFAGIDVFDLEIDESNLDKLVDIIAALEPTFGGINLEDIKAPDCFYVERKLRERMNIPVFHDDQHATAIVVGAAILNGLKVVGKDPKKIKLVTSGAGAAALACLGLLVKLEIPRESIFVTDLAGVVYEGRTELMDADKVVYAQATSARTLGDIIEGADIFLGLSAGGVLKPEMVQGMAAHPLFLPWPIQLQKSHRSKSGPSAMTPSWQPIVPTIPTRSTMSCAFPISSGVRLTPVQPPSRWRWKLRRYMPLPNWRK